MLGTESVASTCVRDTRIVTQCTEHAEPQFKQEAKLATTDQNAHHKCLSNIRNFYMGIINRQFLGLSLQ